MTKYKPILIISILLLAGCGKVSVNLDESTYDPKIVVDGYLIPGTPITVRLMRNYALNTVIRLDEIVIDDARIFITHEGKTCTLSYNPARFLYEYPGDDFRVKYGGSYRLEVSAEVDGHALWTASTTTVPDSGFRILDAQSGPDSLAYREKEAGGDLKKFILTFTRSPNTDSYIGSVVARDASLDTFIEENAFGLDKDMLDEHDLLEELANQWTWTQTEFGEGTSFLDLEWFDFWFYSDYRIILYAADVNFTQYFITHRNIQEIDGNLLEPKFSFEGDGIGVFGSAVADTFYVKVTP
jgi:hypothetical protein